jgi:hypothetical protein
VRIWFDAITAEDRALFSVAAHRVSIPPEGDVVLF